MNKSELIEKWQEKHSSLLSEYNQYHRGSENITAEMENRSKMKDVLEFIEDIKQLNDAMLGTVISNEEICRRKCLDCGYDGCDLGKDSCEKCGCRYEPTEENENCPECGCEEYNSHCPECDSDNIVYWNEYEMMLADGSLS